MTLTVFRYLILITAYFYDFISRFLLSFSFYWEEMFNTQGSIWLHHRTPWSSSKILRCESYFQLSSRCLDMLLNTVFPVWYILCWSGGFLFRFEFTDFFSGKWNSVFWKRGSSRRVKTNFRKFFTMFTAMFFLLILLQKCSAEWFVKSKSPRFT